MTRNPLLCAFAISGLAAFWLASWGVNAWRPEAPQPLIAAYSGP
jgi:hypothetical protein